jgi:hypothetical protein
MRKLSALRSPLHRKTRSSPFAVPTSAMAPRREKPFVFALWLHPAPPARQFFSDLIKRLAREYHAAIFAPHLTLGIVKTEPTLPVVINSRPIRLRVAGLFSSSIFTKTLFVRFESNTALEQLRHSLDLDEIQPDPHLSLLYARLPASEKSRLAPALELPFGSVGFPAVSVARCPRPTVSSCRRRKLGATPFFCRPNGSRAPK